MKLNKLFLSLILSVATVFIYAQEKLTFSIQGGVNYSSLRFEDDRITDHDSEVGYLFGMSSNFYLGKKLYLDIKLIMSVKR